MGDCLPESLGLSLGLGVPFLIVTFLLIKKYRTREGQIKLPPDVEANGRVSAVEAVGSGSEGGRSPLIPPTRIPFEDVDTSKATTSLTRLQSRSQSTGQLPDNASLNRPGGGSSESSSQLQQQFPVDTPPASTDYTTIHQSSTTTQTAQFDAEVAYQSLSDNVEGTDEGTAAASSLSLTDVGLSEIYSEELRGSIGGRSYTVSESDRVGGFYTVTRPGALPPRDVSTS